MDTARGDIGGDEGFNFTVSKVAQRPFALSLRATAMDGGGAQSCLFKSSSDAIGVALGATKDNCRSGCPHDISNQTNSIVALGFPKIVSCV